MRGDAITKSAVTSARWLAAIVFFACAASAHAQVGLERFERQLEQINRDVRLSIEPTIPTDQRTLLEYGGYLSFSFMSIDEVDQSTHILRQTDFNAYARVSIDQVHEVFVRVLSRYRDFNTGDSFDGTGDDWVEPQLERATYKFDLAKARAAYEGQTSKFNFVVQGGRQLVHWANGLALSQDLDGALFTVSYDKLSLLGLAGITRESNFDIDSSRPGYDGDTKRGFFGGMLRYQVTPEHRPYVYGLVQKDYNDQDFDPNSVKDPDDPRVIPTRFHYDSYYIGAGSTGNLGDNLLYAVELVYEGGDGFSNSFDTFGDPIDQTEDDIEAFALDVRLDYLFQDANRSRASAELLLATGDDDRFTTTNTFGGNRPSTTDHAFNGFGLINTGLAFAPEVSNLVMLRGGLSTFPLPESKMFKRLQVGTNLFLFNKLDSGAPIDEATDGGGFLGFEADFFANWQVTSDLSIAMRYGVFLPGGAIAADSDARHFFYTGVTLGF